MALTLYAIFTKTDFTTCGGILVVMLAALFIGGIISIFVKNKWLQLGLSIAGVIVFGIYLVYDTQLTIGKNSWAYSIDDYIVAALSLYLDIIRIFLEILKIVAIAQSERWFLYLIFFKEILLISGVLSGDILLSSTVVVKENQ